MMCPSLSPSPTPSPRICNVMNIIMKADLDINEGAVPPLFCARGLVPLLFSARGSF